MLKGDFGGLPVPPCAAPAVNALEVGRARQAALLLASPPPPWLLAMPCSYRRCPGGSASSSLSRRRRPAQARHTGVRSCAYPCRIVPARYRADAFCPGSRGKMSRPCGRRAGQTSPLMRCRHHSLACRHTNGYERGLRCDTGGA